MDDDLYDFLGVSPDASQEAIRDAYRNVARLYHPDVNPSTDAHVMMQAVNSAYAVLSNPARRKLYDVSRVVLEPEDLDLDAGVDWSTWTPETHWPESSRAYRVKHGRINTWFYHHKNAERALTVVWLAFIIAALWGALYLFGLFGNGILRLFQWALSR